jgi:hypothetical protein
MAYIFDGGLHLLVTISKSKKHRQNFNMFPAKLDVQLLKSWIRECTDGHGELCASSNQHQIQHVAQRRFRTCKLSLRAWPPDRSKRNNSDAKAGTTDAAFSTGMGRTHMLASTDVSLGTKFQPLPSHRSFQTSE